MPARSPAEIDTLFAAGLNADDLEALVSLYEPDAAPVPSPGNVVTGTAAIREALARLLAVRRQPDGRWLLAIDFPFGAHASA